MAKYAVGDKVRVISNPDKSKDYYMLNRSTSDNFTPEMLKLAGQVVTIKSVDKKYRIEELGWFWTDEMFSGLGVKRQWQL